MICPWCFIGKRSLDQAREVLAGQGIEVDIEWLPYQQAYKNDKARFKAAHWSRQAGKSLTSAGETFDDCLEAMIAGKRTRWVILSRGERQSKEVMDEALKPMSRAYWEVYNELRSGFDAPTIEEGVYRVPRSQVDRIDNDYKTLEMIFPHGGRITAVPANPDTARGFSANLLLDEFALHADSRKIWAACFPIVSRAGLKLRVASTGNGKKNMFYEIMTNGDPIWSRHVIDIHRAVREGLDRNIDELRRGLNDEEVWQQEPGGAAAGHRPGHGDHHHARLRGEPHARGRRLAALGRRIGRRPPDPDRPRAARWPVGLSVVRRRAAQRRLRHEHGARRDPPVRRFVQPCGTSRKR